ncbi:MAG: hypothetical protein JOZ55_07555 [Alphaproteobacteria bacterium]|nr:hypothetical protein [Alphaproteobacteria bacterium]
MPRIVVLPLSALKEAIQAHAPSHLVTLLGPDYMIETPNGFPTARHLRLEMHDVIEASEALSPSSVHVAELLAFARTWDARSPMLVHCWAGISRSMAAAFAILCDRMGPGSELGIAQEMRRRAPHADPNRLLVECADTALARGGRMVAAIEAIGRGKLAAEGHPVEFDLAGLS